MSDTSSSNKRPSDGDATGVPVKISKTDSDGVGLPNPKSVPTSHPCPLWLKMHTFFKSGHAKLAFFHADFENLGQKGWKVTCIINDRYLPLELPAMKKVKAQEALASYIFEYYGAEDLSNDTSLSNALRQVKYWNAAAVITQFMPDGLFHLETETKELKTCAFLYGGDTLRRASHASFAEARDMCAMEILKAEEYRAVYVGWVRKAYEMEQGTATIEYHATEVPLNQEQQIAQHKAVASNRKITQGTENFESLVDKDKRIWTQSALQQAYQDALCENPTAELNLLKQKHRWDLNIALVQESAGRGQGYMRAILDLNGEQCTGMAVSKKAAKGVACQAMLMMLGHYRRGAKLTPEALLAAKFKPLTYDQLREKKALGAAAVNSRHVLREDRDNTVQDKLMMIVKFMAFKNPSWEVEMNSKGKRDSEEFWAHCKVGGMVGSGKNSSKRLAKEMAAEEIVSFWEEENGTIENVMKHGLQKKESHQSIEPAAHNVVVNATGGMTF